MRDNNGHQESDCSPSSVSFVSIMETQNDGATLTISMIHVKTVVLVCGVILSRELALGIIDLVLIWRECLSDIFAF
jgi:hypothetical protein